ncbi:MAG: ParA family protein [Reichenbachiella sp.]|uniref:ParA family protein n=2 Tax=Reichenbachiella sp. TaxID=2184521 RepID=UPI003296B347
MSKQGIVIAYTGSKGGVAKSTMTQLMATFLVYLKELKVLVIDADYDQGSIYEDRLGDKKKFEADEIKASYDVKLIPPNEVLDGIDMFKKKYDVIFIDLAGTKMAYGNVESYAAMDKMIIPFSFQKKENNKAKDFYKFLVDEVIPARLDAGLDIPDIVGQLVKISKNSLEYKELVKAKSKYNGKMEEIVEKNMENILGGVEEDQYEHQDYLYPFIILDASITYAEAKFGRHLNTVMDESNADIIERYENELEEVYKYIIA